MLTADMSVKLGHTSASRIKGKISHVYLAKRVNSLKDLIQFVESLQKFLEIFICPEIPGQIGGIRLTQHRVLSFIVYSFISTLVLSYFSHTLLYVSNKRIHAVSKLNILHSPIVSG
jgi:hypothetical protein